MWSWGSSWMAAMCKHEKQVLSTNSPIVCLYSLPTFTFCPQYHGSKVQGGQRIPLNVYKQPAWPANKYSHILSNALPFSPCCDFPDEGNLQYCRREIVWNTVILITPQFIINMTFAAHLNTIHCARVLCYLKCLPLFMCQFPIDCSWSTSMILQHMSHKQDS